MAEIVNLRQFRKTRKREERALLAEENRVLFGEAAARRNVREALRDRETRLHEAHRRDRPNETD